MSALSAVGTVVLGLMGVGFGLLALSAGYMGSFSGSGLAREDPLFVTCAAIGSVICFIAAVALGASLFKGPKR